MTSKNYIKKLGFRFLIINLVYVGVKFTLDHDGDDDFFHPVSLFYYTSAFFLFMSTWEINDYLLRRWQKNYLNTTLEYNQALRILITTMLIMLPVTALTYYLGIFMFDEYCQVQSLFDDPWLRFRVDFLRATLLGFCVVFFNMFFFSINQKKELTTQLELSNKNMLEAQFSSLKSQISPHFYSIV